ncbi:MAG: 2-oxoacid:acceptor oxidoreductase subunit alpha [Methanomicrobiales archaeon]|nr:2-oxoacid:acceptor oxidoreductase subunit alpha [Methanomicrobiales archaeon]
MNEGEISILIGGRAGEGISSAGQIIAQLLSSLGYRVYMYLDYPSRIKGGHNFAIIRGADFSVGAVRETVDVLLAMNKETIDLHKKRLSDNGAILYRADTANVAEGIGVDMKGILASEHAPPVMGNTALLGAFVRSAGIEWSRAEQVFRHAIPKEIELNLRVAHRAYEAGTELLTIPPLITKRLPVVTGNEAIGIGLIEGECLLYCGYPMSPTSNLLHFLAVHANHLGMQVLQPESETAAILIALGGAYAGARTAVGTSGGGFCLMTEALGLAGIAELPVVIVLGQRAGPSTGLATYTAQADLQFALGAGQGEFPRLIAAPGDADEARWWTTTCMDLAWKYQLPAILLADKILCEGMYSLDPMEKPTLQVVPLMAGEVEHPYLRYAMTASGISSLKFPPYKGEVIRVNSHVHDEDGITTEDPQVTRAMADKRAKKLQGLQEEIEKMEPVQVLGIRDASTAILCWGSNKGICAEIGRRLGLRVVQPVVLWPFPESCFARAMEGVERWIGVETNETGQLSRLLRQFGYVPEGVVLKYDGRPFAVEELEGELKGRVA